MTVPPSTYILDSELESDLVLDEYQQARIAILASDRDYELKNALEWLPYDKVQEVFRQLYLEGEFLIDLSGRQ
jgi:hypothetical protein